MAGGVEKGVVMFVLDVNDRKVVTLKLKGLDDGFPRVDIDGSRVIVGDVEGCTISSRLSMVGVVE